MRKFLKLIEESKPGNNSQYVISIDGPAKLEDINVSGDEYTLDLHQKIKAIVEGRADVDVHEEDAETFDDLPFVTRERLEGLYNTDYMKTFIKSFQDIVKDIQEEESFETDDIIKFLVHKMERFPPKEDKVIPSLLLERVRIMNKFKKQLKRLELC